MSTFSSGLQFRVIDGQKEKDRIIRLDGKELTIGRAQKGQRPGQGEVLFREPTVSRIHANLSWKERKGGFQLTHKSGTNPTLVNGKPTKKILLAPGDRVQMGLLILELEDTPGGRTAPAAASIGGDGRNRSSMTEPILEALNKVERQHEEDRRRAKAENEQKQRQREIMASAEPYADPPGPAANSRSRRLDEALRAAPPRPEEERKKRKSGPSFGWQPPEEREVHTSYSAPENAALPRRYPDSPEDRGRLKEVSYEDERTRRTSIPFSPEPASEVTETTSASPARREAVYELVVVKGPDQGRRFPLKDMVMVLGQRQGDHDERDGQGVLLNDATLPAELGMFAWQGREGSYGLLASENSMQIIEVDRISEGARRRIRVDSSSSILLKVADEIQVGLTTLRVQKIGEPVPVFKSRLAPPAEVIPPSSQRQESQPPPLRRNPSEGAGSFTRPAPPGPARPPASPWKEPSAGPPRISPPAQSSHSLASIARNPEPTPLPERSTQPLSPSRHSEPEVPVWAQATLVPGRDQSSPPPSSSSTVSSAPPRQPRPGAPGEEILEWGSRPNVDFLFEFMAGPMRGCVVSMNRTDLSRPRRYNAGSPGARQNEVALEGTDIANEAFHLVGEDGRFSLCNESATGAVMINRSPLKTGDRLVLMTGDLITLGSTQIRFMERDVVKVLSQHGLLAESGVTTDQDRIFGLNRQRLMVGRGKGCDVRLADLEVSRVHLGLAYSEGRFSVQHRSETNPTFLNGLSLMPGTVRTLKVGDRIRLSSLTVLRFVDRSMQ
jgi:pSer/pThr/pTyr-binding forkhead associated (FHA) protein